MTADARSRGQCRSPAQSLSRGVTPAVATRQLRPEAACNVQSRSSIRCRHVKVPTRHPPSRNQEVHCWRVADLGRKAVAGARAQTCMHVCHNSVILFQASDGALVRSMRTEKYLRGSYGNQTLSSYQLIHASVGALLLFRRIRCQRRRSIGRLPMLVVVVLDLATAVRHAQAI